MWAGGKVTKAVLRSSAAGTQHIRVPAGQVVASMSAGRGAVSFQQKGDLVDVRFEGNGIYEVTFR
jgi:hypothetical protein